MHEAQPTKPDASLVRRGTFRCKRDCWTGVLKPSCGNYGLGGCPCLAERILENCSLAVRLEHWCIGDEAAMSGRTTENWAVPCPSLASPNVELHKVIACKNPELLRKMFRPSWKALLGYGSRACLTDRLLAAIGKGLRSHGITGTLTSHVPTTTTNV